MKWIGIVGSRRRNREVDYKACRKAFDKIYKNGDGIVSGGCPKGGDRFAEIIARSEGIPILIYHAAWQRYGRSAGFKRNIHIAKRANVLIALVAPDRKGGTEDTIRKAEKKDIKIILV